jgi:hypothetical protein
MEVVAQVAAVLALTSATTPHPFSAYRVAHSDAD